MPGELYTLRIKARPPHPTPLRNRLFFFPIVLAGVLVILSVQACFVPIGVLSRGWSILKRLVGLSEEGAWLGDAYEWGVKRTKQMFGMLRTCPFPFPFGSLLSTISHPRHCSLCSDNYHPHVRRHHSTRRDPRPSRASKQTRLDVSKAPHGPRHHVESPGIPRLDLHLDPRPPLRDTGHRKGRERIPPRLEKPDHLVEAKPEMGPAPRLGNVSSPRTLSITSNFMSPRQFYRFIFLARSWALDRTNLSLALRDLAARARRGAGLWVLIFPEGTITSDDERAKSVRYARKEGVVSRFRSEWGRWC
jgi:hypothetical protein